MLVEWIKANLTMIVLCSFTFFVGIGIGAAITATIMENIGGNE